MSNTLGRAIALAAIAHEGQVDKQGKPYILHVLDVVLRCETDDERKVAALHDIVENTSMTLEVLSDMFSVGIVEAVDAISNPDGEPYDVYLKRVAANPLAKSVKLYDLSSNLSRLDELAVTQPETALRLRKKYGYALVTLVNAG